MRILKFILPVFVVFIGSFAPHIALAKLATEKTLVKTLDAIHEEAAKEREAKRKQSQEDLTARASEVDINQKTVDATNMVNTGNIQNQSVNDTHKKYMNAGDDFCPDISRSGIGAAFENADMVADELRKARNAAYFANSEKGIKDFSRELYGLMQSLPPERVDIAELFLNPAVPVSGPIATNLDYLEKLLFQRVPVHLLQDLKDNADTDVQNTLIMGDRIAAESRIGSALLSILQGMHAPTPGVDAAKSLKDIMEANGYSSEYVQKTLGGSQPSKYGVLKALTVGQMGQKFVQQNMVKNPENVPAAILFQMMLNNMLLFEQYNLLETIAMSTATNIIANREEAIKDVNALLNQKNAGQ